MKNEKEFDKSSLNGFLKSIENTTSIRQLLSQDKFAPSKLVCKECANVKNKISIDLSQDEKYCSGCKSVKDKIILAVIKIGVRNAKVIL